MTASAYVPDREEFRRKASEGRLIPVYREILADLETPVSALYKINDQGSAFLLESVTGGENLRRNSFLGASPSRVFWSKGNEAHLVENGVDRVFSLDGQDPLEKVKEILKPYQPVPEKRLPPFFGGAVGYVSYDMVRFFENIGEAGNQDMNLPDCLFLITDTILVFDHINHTLKVVSNAFVENDPDAAYEEAIGKIDRLVEKLRKPLEDIPFGCEGADKLDVKSNMSEQQYVEAVRRSKEYILAGDIFQVVLSLRQQVSIQCKPFDIYRALRTINPSPYMFYIQYGDLHLAGSSPEILVKLLGDTVQVRPIAGTRARGRSLEEDARLEKELLADEKELAEHIMLVDLGRNDVGIVSRSGTVKVTDLKVIERYSHVMHIVSNVEGQLRPEKDAFDVLRACFPAGTVSGAPKIRAMQIIEELEPTRRGPYAGALGYISFSGDLDTGITIRTVVIKGDTAYVQSGAGIVADSVPEKEYEEAQNKARGMLKAIQLAEGARGIR